MAAPASSAPTAPAIARLQFSARSAGRWNWAIRCGSWSSRLGGRRGSGTAIGMAWAGQAQAALKRHLFKAGLRSGPISSSNHLLLHAKSRHWRRGSSPEFQQQVEGLVGRFRWNQARDSDTSSKPVAALLLPPRASMRPNRIHRRARLALPLNTMCSREVGDPRLLSWSVAASCRTPEIQADHRLLLLVDAHQHAPRWQVGGCGAPEDLRAIRLEAQVGKRAAEPAAMEDLHSAG